MIRRIIALYGRLVDVLDRFVNAATALLLGLVIIFTGAEIFSRNLFGYSSPEGVDITLSIAILIYLLGYLVLMNRNQDVTMDFIYLRLSARSRLILDALTALGSLVFFIVLAVKSLQLFRMGLNSLHPVFPVPYGIVVIPVVIAAFGGLLVALRKTLDAVFALVTGELPAAGKQP